jgi:hypothetical protein
MLVVLPDQARQPHRRLPRLFAARVEEDNGATALLQHKLMSPAAYREMYTRTIPPWSDTTWHFTPGWQARMAGEDEVVAKNGMVKGYACQWQFVPERGIAVIMIWNLSAKGDDLWPNTGELLWQDFGVKPPQRQDDVLSATPEQ